MNPLTEKNIEIADIMRIYKNMHILVSDLYIINQFINGDEILRCTTSYIDGRELIREFLEEESSICNVKYSYDNKYDVCKLTITGTRKINVLWSLHREICSFKLKIERKNEENMLNCCDDLKIKSIMINRDIMRMYDKMCILENDNFKYFDYKDKGPSYYRIFSYAECREQIISFLGTYVTFPLGTVQYKYEKGYICKIVIFEKKINEHSSNLKIKRISEEYNYGYSDE